MLILVAESDTQSGRRLARLLRAQGHAVEWVRSGGAALERWTSSLVDLVIAATELTDMSGLELCRQIRTQSHVPIFLVGPGSDLETCVAGLNLGADAYLPTPVDPRELAARAWSIFRRAEHAAAPEVIEVGDLRIHVTDFRVLLREQVIELRPQEYRLLLVLARNRGEFFSRERLLEVAWSRRVDIGTVGVHLAWLRRKLLGSNVCIAKVPSKGYRLDVQPAEVANDG